MGMDGDGDGDCWCLFFVVFEVMLISFMMDV